MDINPTIKFVDAQDIFLFMGEDLTKTVLQRMTGVKPQCLSDFFLSINKLKKKFNIIYLAKEKLKNLDTQNLGINEQYESLYSLYVELKKLFYSFNEDKFINSSSYSSPEIELKYILSPILEKVESDLKESLKELSKKKRSINEQREKQLKSDFKKFEEKYLDNGDFEGQVKTEYFIVSDDRSAYNFFKKTSYDFEEDYYCNAAQMFLSLSNSVF